MVPADLRELLRFAAQAGADPVWLDRVAAAIHALLLEVDELRAVQDRRRLATLRLAARVSQADRAMRKTGSSDRVTKLCERFSLRRSRVYELLAMSGEPPDTLPVRSRRRSTRTS